MMTKNCRILDYHGVPDLRRIHVEQMFFRLVSIVLMRFSSSERRVKRLKHSPIQS